MSAFAQPSSGGDKFDVKNHGQDYLGGLMVVWPIEVKANFDSGQYEPTDVVVADIGIIDRFDPATGKPYFFKDAFIFSKGLVSNTRSKIGQIVLGRLVKKQFANGVGWSLDEFTPDDAAKAEQYLTTNPRETFAPPAAAAPAHDAWAGMNTTATPPTTPPPAAWQAAGAPPQQYAAPPPAPAAPAPPAPSSPGAPSGVEPALVAFLASKGVPLQPGTTQEAALQLAAMFPQQ